MSGSKSNLSDKIFPSNEGLMAPRIAWMSTVFIVCVIGNGILIIVTLRKKKYQNITNFFNLNLSVSDILKVVTFVPVYLVYWKNESWPLGLTGCRATYVFFYTGYGASVMLLMCLSWERYNLVVKPLKKQMNMRTAELLTVVCWAGALLCASLFAASVDLVSLSENGSVHCWIVNDDENRARAIILAIVIILGASPLVFFVITYFKIIRKLKSDGVCPSDSTQSSINRAKRNKRAISILLTEVILFIVCIIPFYFLTLKTTFLPLRASNPFALESLLVFGNMVTFSAINPVIHIFFNPEFRKEVKCLFVDMRGCGTADQWRLDHHSTKHAVESIRSL